MNVAYISALSALAGSVVGGLTAGFTTWLSHRAQARAGQLAHDKSPRDRTIRDLHELMKNGAAIDPLKEFSEAAREELRARR